MNKHVQHLLYLRFYMTKETYGKHNFKPCAQNTCVVKSVVSWHDWPCSSSVRYTVVFNGVFTHSQQVNSCNMMTFIQYPLCLRKYTNCEQ